MLQYHIELMKNVVVIDCFYFSNLACISQRDAPHKNITMLIVNVPNFAPILINAKFPRCCVMNMKIYGMNTFLVESNFVFIMVILKFFSFLPFLKE